MTEKQTGYAGDIICFRWTTEIAFMTCTRFRTDFIGARFVFNYDGYLCRTPSSGSRGSSRPRHDECPNRYRSNDGVVFLGVIRRYERSITRTRTHTHPVLRGYVYFFFWGFRIIYLLLLFSVVRVYATNPVVFRLNKLVSDPRQ